MSLITRCPACATLFKVVPDQLRISEGWVRCGQCDEVFDANVHLQADVLVAETPSAPVVDTFGTSLANALEEDEGTAQATNPDSFEPSLSSELPETPEPDAFFQASPHQLASLSEHLEPSGFGEESLAHTPDAARSPPGAKLHTQLETPRYSQADRSAHRVDEDFQPSFMASDAKSRSLWRRPWARAGLAVAAVLLGLLLLVQVVVHERNRIAAMEPSLHPLLTSMCGVYGCTISPLHQIESVVIDSSSFAKVRTEMYRLSFTFKNTAPIALATPALELTLTDSQDQPVLRRVLVPSDFGGHQTTISPEGDLTVSMPMAIKLAAPTERISGYRLLAFYP